MFGADAPKLTRLIIQELEFEAQAQKNERERIKIAFVDLTPAELVWNALHITKYQYDNLIILQERKTIEDKKEEAIAEIEKKAAKIAQIERCRKRSEMMTPFIADFNILLFWPHAFDGHKLIYESWDALGI